MNYAHRLLRPGNAAQPHHHIIPRPRNDLSPNGGPARNHGHEDGINSKTGIDAPVNAIVPGQINAFKILHKIVFAVLPIVATFAAARLIDRGYRQETNNAKI